MKQINQNGLRYYQDERWQHLRHGVFTRLGGHSSAPWQSLNVGGTVGDDPHIVRENHHKIYETLSIDPQRTCTTWQVHGVDVVVANAPVPMRRWLARADALITNQPDLALVQRYADCVPLLYHDPVKQVIGVAHAGWRGTVGGVAGNVVRAMQNAYGTRPQDVQVLIGTSISPEYFQVGQEVVDAIHARYGTDQRLVTWHPDDGTPYVDLWRANRIDLERLGVHQIEVMGMCTVRDNHEFFSHRAEKGRAGRFAVVMSL